MDYAALQEAQQDAIGMERRSCIGDLIEPVDKICINCRYYQAAKTERDDVCLHERASKGGVRKLEQYSCSSMVAGICSKNELFEARP